LFPNFNLYSRDRKQRATILFLGSNLPLKTIKRVFDNVKAKLLRNGDDDARLVAWYFDGQGNAQIYPPAIETLIDEASSEHPAVIDGSG